MIEPRIYSENYLTSENLIISSHGQTFIENTYDRDNATQYVSSGANSDATWFNITITFVRAGIVTAIPIDSIVIANHNLKNIYLWNNDPLVNAELAPIVSGITSDSTLITFTPTTTSSIIIYAQQTQIANQEKKIGEILICKSLIDIDKDISGYNASSRNMENILKLADGSIHRTFIKNTVTRNEKYEAKVSFDYLSKSKLAEFISLKDSGTTFLWQPESIASPGDVFLVHWVGALNWKYMSTFKDAGIRLEMDLKEV